MAGVDGRSARARRYRVVLRDLLADLSDEQNPLGAADLALAQQGALLIVRSETLRAAILNGDADADDDALVRLSNSAVRVLNALRGKKRAAAHTPSLAEYLRDTASKETESTNENP